MDNKNENKYPFEWLNQKDNFDLNYREYRYFNEYGTVNELKEI